MAKPIEDVSDHKLIKLVVGADVRHKKNKTEWQQYDKAKCVIPTTKFPQSNIKRMMSDERVQQYLLESGVNLM